MCLFHGPTLPCDVLNKSLNLFVFLSLYSKEINRLICHNYFCPGFLTGSTATSQSSSVSPGMLCGSFVQDEV